MASGFAREALLNECEALSTPRADCAALGGASSARRSLAVAALVLVALLLPLLHTFDEPARGMDEGSLLVYPELILKGNLPYRDFETFYGPANIYALSGVYAAFGPSILAERATGLVYRLLILAAVFCITRRWGATLAAGATLMAGAVLLNLGVVAYAWMGGIACALWSIFIVSKTDSRVRCFFGGMLGAAVLLFRPDLGPAVILGTLPLFLRMSRVAKLRYLGGMCIGLLPLGLLAVAAGPQQVLDNLLLFPVFYGNGGRHLPLAHAAAWMLGMLAAHLIASCVNILAGVIALRRQPQLIAGRLLLGAALFAVALTHQALQRLDGMHVLFAAFASLAILPISLFVLLSRTSFLSLRQKAMIAVAAAAGFGAVFAPALPVYVYNRVVAALNPNVRQSLMLEQNGRRIPLATMPLVRITGALLDRIERMAAPGDRLFVGPADLRRTNYNDTFLYHMLPQFRPATYFLEMNPGSANRPNSRLASDIRTADWLILNRAYDNWREPNSSSRNGSDEPNVVVRAEFTVCGEFGDYLLFRRKSPRG
jgi:hypothetical protein